MNKLLLAGIGVASVACFVACNQGQSNTNKQANATPDAKHELQ